MPVKKLLLLYLLSCCLLPSQAQEKTYMFSHYGLREGLYEENVLRICQDRKGFIWVVSANALQRFDGKRFLTFFPGENLPDGLIRDAVIDHKNRLWLLTDDARIGYFDPATYRYNPVMVIPPGEQEKVIHWIFSDNQDRLFLIWDTKKFSTYTDASGEATAANNPFVLPSGTGIRSLFQDNQQQYWINTDNGLVKFNPKTNVLSANGSNPENDPCIRQFSATPDPGFFYKDQQERAWQISWGDRLHIRSLDKQTGKLINWDTRINQLNAGAYYVPRQVHQSSNGDIWITGSEVFAKISPDLQQLQLIPKAVAGEYGIQYDEIFTLYEDREQNLWLGSNKGLYRFNPVSQRFSSFSIRQPDRQDARKAEVTAFLELADGTRLVSTWGHGLYAYNQAFNPVSYPGITGTELAASGMIWDMLQRENGDIWLAMPGGSVFVLKKGKKQVENIRLPDAAGATIRQIETDQRGNIWAGTQRGELIRWNAAQQTFSLMHRFNTVISRIITDQTGHIWVCTDYRGVHRFSPDGQLLASYTKGKPGDATGITARGAADILQYNDSTFIIASTGIDILNIHTGRIVHFNRNNGMPNPNVYSLQKDQKGYIWMATAGGILSFHPVLRKLSHYAAEDGVNSYSFSTGAAYAFRNSTIAFGTISNFITFKSDELEAITYSPPEVAIAGIDIGGKPTPVDSLLSLEQIELPYAENNLRIFLTTLRFQDTYNIRYMLEGLNKTWQEVDNRQVLEFNYLPAGRYTLKLACVNVDGTPATITAVQLLIHPPFYKTWWFYGTVLLLAAWILVLLDRERMKRKKATQQIRSNIAGKLHSDINQALNTIHILSGMATRKAETDPKKSMEYVEQIHTRSETMMVAMDDMLWSISPENDSLEKTLQRIREFADDQMNRYGVKIEMDADPKIRSTDLSMKLRHEAYLLFKDSLTGLMKAGGSDIRILFTPDKNWLLLIIEFNTRQCDLGQLDHFFNSRELKEKLDAINAVTAVFVHKSHAVLECRLPASG